MATKRFNLFEERARMEKASRLADFLQFQLRITGVSEVRLMDDGDWQMVAEASQIGAVARGHRVMPSLQTRAMVIGILEHRFSRGLRVVSSRPADPFAGFDPPEAA